MSRLLIGSVSERVAKHARCSVLVARNHHDSPDVHNVMLAYDHSPGAQAAVQRFAMLPLGSERSVTLHTVVVPQQRYGRERLTLVDEETLTQTAESQLDAAAAMFDHTQCKVRTILHRGADSADDLLDTAAEEDADLIVVGSTGKNAIERFLLGSFSLQVLHHAPCSVWVERGNSPSAEG